VDQVSKKSRFIVCRPDGKDPCIETDIITEAAMWLLLGYHLAEYIWDKQLQTWVFVRNHEARGTWLQNDPADHPEEFE